MELLVAPEALTVAKVERVLGMPYEMWVGNCYGIACALVKHKLTDGEAVYGEYIGPIDPEGAWCRDGGRTVFVNHGWVRLPDGRVLDPTMWAFLGRKPFIWLGADELHHDEGANRRKAAFLRPPPGYSPEDRQVALDLTGEALAHVEALLLADAPPFSINQVVWLANLPLSMLGEHVDAVFLAICKSDNAPLIPWDNRKKWIRAYGRHEWAA